LLGVAPQYIFKVEEGEFAYTDEEWKKIEKLVLKKVKKYKTSKSAKNHIDAL
jgi:hypothetical protein